MDETKVTVLWAVKIGEPDYMAQLITEHGNDPKILEAAKAWATANNFDRMRVDVIDLTQPPDFIGTIAR